MLMADSRYIPRTLDIAGLSRRKSLFLFGPRQTGKTALIRHALPSAKVYDLLDGDVFRTLSHRPARLGEELESGDRLVVVDGIQKLPELLDEVHRLIERRSIHFVLTGSSARKLRRGGVNLLGGRAPTRTLHPFTYRRRRIRAGTRIGSRALAIHLLLHSPQGRSRRLRGRLSERRGRGGSFDAERSGVQPVSGGCRAVPRDDVELFTNCQRRANADQHRPRVFPHP